MSNTCSRCRKNNEELLTRWERVRNWLFYKLFPQDIIDLSQDKYTQGFGDGLIKGQNWARKDLQEVAKKIYNIDL